MRSGARSGSWRCPLEFAPACRRDLRHQLRRVLEVPIRVGDEAMAEVRGDSEHMLANSTAVARRALKRAHRERMTDVVDAWTTLRIRRERRALAHDAPCSAESRL